MSREPDDEDATLAAWHQHEQELLQQNPAFLQWLERFDAGHEPQHTQEHERDRP